MSTVFVAVALLGFIVLVTLLFTTIEKRKKRASMNQFLNRFIELGSLNNLTFSSQEILKDAAIGLDGIHRRLLVLYGNHETTFRHRLFHLSDVATCSVKKQYATVNAPGSKNNTVDQYLEKIMLRFEMKSGEEPVEVNFYHHVTCDVYEIKDMAEKAKHWEAILSKMLKSPLKAVA
jgi:hypothetical protein